jgi:ATP-binding cassette subfamily B multidrug efflux pump
VSNQKEMSIDRPGGNPMARFDKKKQKLKNPKETIKRLLKYLDNKKRLVVLIFILAFIATIISIVGTRLTGYTVDNFIKNGDLMGLARICGLLGVIYFVSIISTYIQNRFMVNIAQRTTLDIRRDLFVSMQKLPLKYFDTHSSGDLMSRLTNDMDNINMTLSQNVTQLFSGVINILGMLIAMLLLSPILTLVGLITIPFMFLITGFIVKKTQPFFTAQQKELGNLNGYIEEMVSGQKAVLLFSQEEQVKEQFSKINKKLTLSSIYAQMISGCMGPVNNFINNLG